MVNGHNKKNHINFFMFLEFFSVEKIIISVEWADPHPHYGR